MKKLMPPVGISHTTHHIEDLYSHKFIGKNRVVFHPAAQLNSFPHFGTVTTLISAFALAKKLKEKLDIEVDILFWELENAPGELLEIEGRVYYQTLATTSSRGAVSASEKYLKEFRHLLKIFAEISGIPYRTWNFNEFQKKSEIRRIILDLIDMESELAPLLCPSEQSFKVRFACPECHFADKAGGVLTGTGYHGERYYECICPKHGVYNGTLAEDNCDLFDINTPIRALAREIYYIRKMRSINGQNMMCDGADWVQYATINMEALLRYGISVENHPARFFAPVILDEYGAKLSKSAQVGTGRYTHLPKYSVDSRELLRTFGEDIYQVLWKEVTSWQDDPRRLFRNYTMCYFDNLGR